ncbi:sulfur carrier protein ThiS [Undibacterium sp.]|jgi:sulfur carrier protein|uniref:sulfur carrier protein ThiS n=1 Tax=Undibacterium sp. TaxID=1914977 RepID=UPI002B6AFAD2|nr:sulfur carrier protein ThiS [Undibacterium sp.]HTD03336.1 sulfur carrier protein ThiS [Undibacterium sp.]
MDIELNGAVHQVAEGQNLSELVAALNLSNQAIAVAVNRQIIARSLWQTHLLQPQDKVDVVRAIGGG